jgi:hypothetical protein
MQKLLVRYRDRWDWLKKNAKAMRGGGQGAVEPIEEAGPS